MLYAIHEAGLPITITNPESVRKRLLAQDNVDVIPSYDSYHRANQYFPAKQDVFEVLHYKDLGRYKMKNLTVHYLGATSYFEAQGMRGLLLLPNESHDIC